MIERELGYHYADILEKAVEKTRFTLKMYDRYRRNFKEKREVLERTTFNWGEEQGLLLEDLDEAGFYAFLGSFREFLMNLVGRVG
jgi:hypothetical protein